MTFELEYDYKKATESMNIFSQDDIDLIKEWTLKLDKSKYVPKDLTNKQILLFYNACYGDIDKTKTCIEKYYNYRKNAPELFDNRVLSADDLRTATEVLEYSLIPGTSCDGYDIIYHRLYDTEPSKYHLETGVRLLFMVVDACLSKRGPSPGFIFIFDMRGVKLGHLARISLLTLRKFFNYLQEAMPVRMKAIHVLNSESMLDKLIMLIRPFMDKKFFDMMQFHIKDENLEKFYQTVIPRSSLPSDHGGTLPDVQTLHKKCMEQLKEMEPHFRAEEDQRINALPDKKRDKAMQKAFRNLDID